MGHVAPVVTMMVARIMRRGGARGESDSRAQKHRGEGHFQHARSPFRAFSAEVDAGSAQKTRQYKNLERFLILFDRKSL
jgi:hypothetical protein